MILIERNFDLKGSIFSGQCFRASEKDDYYILIISDRVLKIEEDEKHYKVSSNNEKNIKEVVENYFDLKRDYDLINNLLMAQDENMKKIVVKSKGHKILRQDIFEMFISYIISQNNNVKRISGSINKLSKLFGEKIVFENEEYYLFPKMEAMLKLTQDDLKECGLGFRDKYVLNALDVLINDPDYLNRLDEKDTKSAMEELLKIKGIGAKVSSCILMFGYGRFDAYPIDVWVKKYLQDKYNIKNIKNLQNELYNKFGNYAGLAIQYMFNYERNIKSQL